MRLHAIPSNELHTAGIIVDRQLPLAERLQHQAVRVSDLEDPAATDVLLAQRLAQEAQLVLLEEPYDGPEHDVQLALVGIVLRRLAVRHAEIVHVPTVFSDRSVQRREAEHREPLVAQEPLDPLLHPIPYR